MPDDQPTARPGRRAIPRGAQRPVARAGRAALPAGRDLGRAGRELRAVLGQRHQGRALPVRRPRRARDRAHRAARIHRRGLARLPAGSAAGHDLRLPRARPPTRRRTGTASTRTSCCSTPTPRGSIGEIRWDPALFGYDQDSPDEDLSFDERDSAPFMPKCRVIDPAFTWGRDRKPGGAVGPDDLLRDAREGLHQAASGGAGEPARHLCRPRRARRWWTTSRASASPRSSCCRSTPSCRTSTCWTRA